MAKYIEKPVDVEAITFSELVEYGKANGGNIVNGMPWSFSYKGHPVTHENDQCYLIGSPTGGTLIFTPDDMLVSVCIGMMHVCTKEAFDLAYVPAPLVGETCENCGGPLGDDAPLYEDADICRKCHEEIQAEEAVLP